MDFAWTREQQELRDGILEFARGALNEGIIERDVAGEFNREGWKRCAEVGIHGLPIPTEYGGLGLDTLTTVGVLERLGYGCKDNGLVFSINAHMWTLSVPILHFGTPEQKKRWLPGLCNGSLIGANGMSEPGSGSDAYSMSTTARRDGDAYVLNGGKTWVTNGSVCDVALVYASTDPSKGAAGISAFLVERGTPGFSTGNHIEKMGIRTSPMGDLYFDDCRVPVENRIGADGDGVTLFTHSMTWERSCILASAVGAMDRLLETTIRHAKTRKQFGQSIGKFQMVASRIVDMKLRVETARALLYRTAWQRDQGRNIFIESAMTKLHISESWVQVAQDAMHVQGGYGYMRESGIEREVRDAMGSRIYSGTSEIQRVLIASMLGL